MKFRMWGLKYKKVHTIFNYNAYIIQHPREITE